MPPGTVTPKTNSFTQFSSLIKKNIFEKTFSEIYQKTEFKEIPNRIHMIWVGSKPGSAQQDYLRQWAEMNPNADVNLWVDSTQFSA